MASLTHKLLSDAQVEIHDDEQSSSGTNAPSNVQLLSDHKAMVFGDLDIMEMVFNDFPGDNNSSPSTTQCLLWAALTSRHFFNPAMNVLWRSLNSMRPILNLIPNPKKRLSSRTGMNKNLSAVDGTSKERLLFQRADQYHRRIRHLTCNGSDEEHPSIVEYISLFDRDQFNLEYGLFPCLRSFEASGLGRLKHKDLQALARIPPPTLSKVTLFTGCGDDKVQAFVETLFTRLLHMNSESLITLHSDHEAPTAKYSQALQQFSNLRCLSLVIADAQAESLLTAVVHLVNLRDLTLMYPPHRGEKIEFTTSTIFPTEFPLLDKLERLEVKGNSLFLRTVIVSIFKHMPNLKSLLVKLMSFDPMDDEHLLLIKDAAMYAPSVECLLLDVEHVTDTAFHWSTFKCISSWKFLKSLEILHPWVPIENDRDRTGDYLVLLNGLDMLKRLTVTMQHLHMGKRKHERFMFLSFPQIARCCPRLLSLAISICFPLYPDVLELMERALTLDIHQDPGHGGLRNVGPHGLKWLIFLAVPGLAWERAESFESATIVARYINVIFPQLEYVIFNGVNRSGGLDFAKRWTDTVVSMTGASARQGN